MLLKQEYGHGTRTSKESGDHTLSEQEHADLQVLARSRSLPHSVVRRAQMILMSAEGYSNNAIAEHFGLTLPSAGHWRKRYLSQGIAGLYDAARPGRPRSYDDDHIATLLNKVLKDKPKRTTHWSTPASEETGMSKSTVQRYPYLFGVQPHRSKSFKLSTDPFFVEKVRDIVGLYLDPPAKALVLCVDEKSPIQGIERSQPAIPAGMGGVEGIAHDYLRHDDPVCSTGRGQRRSHWTMHGTPPASGVSIIPAPCR